MSVGKGQPTKNTGIEMALRAALRGVDLLGYRLHHRIELPPFRGRPQHTTPDVCFVGLKVAVYVDGCWFHGCLLHASRANAEWREKQARARARDKRHSRYLETRGWRVFRTSGCEDPKAAAKAIKALIDVGSAPGTYCLPPKEESQ